MKKYNDYTHYRRWRGMINRCYNKKHTYYYNYGGRGITICDEWKEDYEKFCEWANKSGYKVGLTLDRIDNDKGYSPVTVDGQLEKNKIEIKEQIVRLQ